VTTHADVSRPTIDAAAPPPPPPGGGVTHLDLCPHDEGEHCDCHTTQPRPTPARPPNPQAVHARRLAAQGWTTDRIAAELGCHRRSVQRYLQGVS
jgi:Homeodomain-like domain-containing protein